MLVSVFPRFTGDYNLRYSDGGMSQPDYARLRDSAESLSSLAAYRLLNVTLSGPESGSIRAGLVSCNVTDVLETGSADPRPLPPRPTSATSQTLRVSRCSANAPGAPGSGSAADIVGRQILFEPAALYCRRRFAQSACCPDRAMIPTCGFPIRCSVNFVPPTRLHFADPRAQWLNVTGRRKPDRSLRQVEEELRAIARSHRCRRPRPPHVVDRH